MVIAAAGAIQAGQAQKKQMKYQAAVARQQADRERQIAAVNERNFRRRQRALRAKAFAASGARGGDPTSGSLLKVDYDYAQEVEYQALVIRAGGETQATRLEQQAGQFEFTGRQAAIGGYFRAGASLAQGYGNLRRGPGQKTTTTSGYGPGGSYPAPG
jgi:hypothetical protein